MTAVRESRLDIVPPLYLGFVMRCTITYQANNEQREKQAVKQIEQREERHDDRPTTKSPYALLPGCPKRAQRGGQPRRHLYDTSF